MVSVFRWAQEEGIVHLSRGSLTCAINNFNHGDEGSAKASVHYVNKHTNFVGVEHTHMLSSKHSDYFAITITILKSKDSTHDSAFLARGP